MPAQSSFDIRSNYPVYAAPVENGGVVTPDLERDESFGVLLNSNATIADRPLAVDWIEVEPDSENGVAHVTHYLNRHGAYRMSRSLGAIGVGGNIVIGRNYQTIDSPMVSREHVQIHPVWVSAERQRMLGVQIMDLHSVNGSSLWRRGEGTADSSADTAQAEEASESPAERLMHKHGVEFKELELIDYGMLSNMITAHKGELTRSDKKGILLLVHPDKNVTGDPKRSHQLFLLAQRLLDLSL